MPIFGASTEPPFAVAVGVRTTSKCLRVAWRIGPCIPRRLGEVPRHLVVQIPQLGMLPTSRGVSAAPAGLRATIWHEISFRSTAVPISGNEKSDRKHQSKCQETDGQPARVILRQSH